MKAIKLLILSAMLCAAPLVFAEDTVLRFASWNNGESLQHQKDVARMFEAQNPGVTIQVEAHSDNYDQKLAASFGGKNPPDVMFMWNFPHYYTSLEPLNDYIENDSSLDLSDIPPGLLNYNKIGQNLYGLPVGFTSHVVYYNKDLFDQAGVDYPQEGWTWQDFRTTAKAFRNKEEKRYGFGFYAQPDPYDFEQYMWSNGTSYISQDGKAVDGYMNSPAAAEVLGMFVGMLKNEEAVLIGSSGADSSGSGLFKADRIAMYESGIWPKSGFEAAKKNFGIASLPSFPGKTVKSVINQSGMSMAKDSKNKALAWKFIKFFVSPEAIKARPTDLPIRRSVIKELQFDQDPQMKAFFTMLESSDQTPAFMLNKKWGKIQKNLALAIETALLKQSDAQSNLDAAVKKSARHLR